MKKYLNPKIPVDELAEEKVLRRSLDQAGSSLLQTLGLDAVDGDKGMLVFHPSRCMYVLSMLNLASAAT